MRAVAEKPLDAVVKFDTYRSECTAESRGSPCDSTAVVYINPDQIIALTKHAAHVFVLCLLVFF